ncbi:MAG: winged helix-turn-helix transcriptional regulator, partial [Candidatus Lokiarchaeota archaeon]|nr:winged helix-turn-helix transcriptional regulator [Candidatus Lokiarchaeota archaeon]
FNFFFKISLILITICLLFFLFYQVSYWSNSFFLDPIFESMIMTVLLLIISLILIVGAITLLEYKTKFLHKKVLSTSRSYLTIEDVFKNDNRINIISQVLKNPGIHHNELLRTCNLQKGQLQWHLDILLKNNIIEKENQGQYTLYYANNQIIESSHSVKEGIVDTSSTKKILDIIRENPGITSTFIAENINLAINTVSYHIDKLIGANLIKVQKKGRKKEIFPIKKEKKE